MLRCWMMFLTFCIFMGLSAATAGASQEPVLEKIAVNGENRTYWLYLPQGLDKKKPLPLIFVLHGSAGSGEDMMKVTQRGFERLSDRDKFVVVYPNVLGGRWNEQDGTTDDAGFFLAVADHLAAQGLVDVKRVYVAGLSNGGMMAQRMACEQSDKVAAIASVAGSMTEKMAIACKPSRAVPVLLIHGTEDPIIPWNGGFIAGFEEYGKVISARETVRFWAEHNKCNGTAVVSPEPDRDPQDGTRVQFEIFAGCSNKSEVTLVAIEGGGHTWPGGYQYMPERFIGRTSKDIDANTVIWNFLRSYSSP